jgi:hypothetical protein
MSQVRFQILFGPASLRPRQMSWPLPAGADNGPAAGQDVQAWVERLLPGPQEAAEMATGTTIIAAVAPPVAAPQPGSWYGWRLIGANNRELGRSAVSFVSYQLARRAILQLKQGIGALVHHSMTDPRTGRWGWRFDLEESAVAVSSRWYERDHDGRTGAAKFVALTADAEMAEGVVTLHERRSLSVVRLPGGGGA